MAGYSTLTVNRKTRTMCKHMVYELYLGQNNCGVLSFLTAVVRLRKVEYFVFIFMSDVTEKDIQHVCINIPYVYLSMLFFSYQAVTSSNRLHSLYKMYILYYYYY
ncbi:hypothetical protein HUJ04_004606 [Dendroctonus ponderosae]|nr:hypothetical protein HUJ04_004606 [Dendroctonus ponderosae]KAH1014861.1 hypothetical protein HUJ05_012676 [Dendroctonus ponderosae]